MEKGAAVIFPLLMDSETGMVVPGADHFEEFPDLFQESECFVNASKYCVTKEFSLEVVHGLVDQWLSDGTRFQHETTQAPAEDIFTTRKVAALDNNASCRLWSDLTCSSA